MRCEGVCFARWNLTSNNGVLQWSCRSFWRQVPKLVPRLSSRWSNDWLFLFPSRQGISLISAVAGAKLKKNEGGPRVRLSIYLYTYIYILSTLLEIVTDFSFAKKKGKRKETKKRILLSKKVISLRRALNRLYEKFSSFQFVFLRKGRNFFCLLKKNIRLFLLFFCFI